MLPAPEDTPIPSATPTPEPTVPAAQTPATASAPAATPTPEPPTPEPPAPEPPSVPVVTVSIDTPDGALLNAAEVPFTDGLTAEKALRAVCEAADLSVEIRSPGRRAYLVSIGGYAEFGQGTGSGWVYQHNGSLVSVGIGARTLAEGDRLRFWYTLDFGADAE